MPLLFVEGKYFITGEQIHRQSSWCAVEDKGGQTALEYENIPPDRPGEDRCSNDVT